MKNDFIDRMTIALLRERGFHVAAKDLTKKGRPKAGDEIAFINTLPKKHQLLEELANVEKTNTIPDWATIIFYTSAGSFVFLSESTVKEYTNITETVVKDGKISSWINPHNPDDVKRQQQIDSYGKG